MTIHEVSKLTGVTVRTLHYYDKIGLLPVKHFTEAGYRLYDEKDLERLSLILLFKELEFPLKEIGKIIDQPTFDRNKALEQQIELLKLRKEHIENLIDLATGMKVIGVKYMSFNAFDTKKIDEYARQAKESWGNTPAYHEYESKSKNRSKTEERILGEQMMAIMAEFGSLKKLSPSDAQVRFQVVKLSGFITEHYYTCTDEILQSLGMMYSGGGSMTENIDAAGGEGTADFIHHAIEAYLAGK